MINLSDSSVPGILSINPQTPVKKYSRIKAVATSISK